jgi:hypothetical protein
MRVSLSKNDSLIHLIHRFGLIEKTGCSHGFNEVDDRRDDKRADVSSDEIEQDSELRQTLQISLQTEKQNYELAQEQTHQPHEREQNETRPAFVSDGSIGGESGKKSHTQK